MAADQETFTVSVKLLVGDLVFIDLPVTASVLDLKTAIFQQLPDLPIHAQRLVLLSDDESIQGTHLFIQNKRLSSYGVKSNSIILLLIDELRYKSISPDCIHFTKFSRVDNLFRSLRVLQSEDDGANQLVAIGPSELQGLPRSTSLSPCFALCDRPLPRDVPSFWAAEIKGCHFMRLGVTSTPVINSNRAEEFVDLITNHCTGVDIDQRSVYRRFCSIVDIATANQDGDDVAGDSGASMRLVENDILLFRYQPSGCLEHENDKRLSMPFAASASQIFTQPSPSSSSSDSVTCSTSSPLLTVLHTRNQTHFTVPYSSASEVLESDLSSSSTSPPCLDMDAFIYLQLLSPTSHILLRACTQDEMEQIETVFQYVLSHSMVDSSSLD